MARPSVALPQEDLDPLRAQITKWRANRRTPCAMPEELWAEAVAPALSSSASTAWSAILTS